MTEYKEMTIYLQSPIYSIQQMGNDVQTTKRFNLRYIYANYSTAAVGLTFNLCIKKGLDDTEIIYPLPLPYVLKYLKRELRKGIVCREFRFEIVGTLVTDVKIYDAGVLGFIQRVGKK